MAQHKQPHEIAVLKGANKVNPGRYREVPKSDMPLGDPADHLSEGAAACWFELSTLAIPGVLTGSDRIILEVAANLLSEYRVNPDDFAIGKYTHLISCLARFGMSPSDRNNLGLGKLKDDDDDFEDL